MEFKKVRAGDSGRYRVAKPGVNPTPIAGIGLAHKNQKEITHEPGSILRQVHTENVTETPYLNNEPNNKSKLVQMRFQPRTIESIDDLSKLTRIDNKTQLVSSAIQLTAELLSSLKQGAKIYIEQPNGQKELLKFVGF